jgi:curved DNA-binding protein
MTAPISDSSFKDHFQTLQVHPEAESRTVDSAYWNLARRYMADARSNASAKANLEDLNEAYSVIGSPSRRKAYVTARNGALRESA